MDDSGLRASLEPRSTTRRRADFRRSVLAPAAAPQPDWPDHVRTTGFVFYNGPDHLSPELESFLDQGPAPVVFTLGTSAVGAAGHFYDESAKAARRMGLRAVLMTGGFAENEPAGDRESILIVDRAPHQLLFPRAAAVVQQGGIGTTAQALRSGRPMIIVPYAHDQPDNAYRVGKLGVSRTIFPESYKAARVERELTRILSDPDCARRAAEVATTVRAEGGAGAAADAIADPLNLVMGKVGNGEMEWGNGMGKCH